jgi:flagellin
VSFSILTNVASLQAQNYLRINSNFQDQTIAEVTSGLRIVNSGDDAAGLAIANGYRSDEAVLTQGIQNANDGLSQLQILDGGLSNISQLLDRARTLATESASGTFTGDRGVLNDEFQSVIGEIDRQAQSIGLNQGGSFAKDLSVFIGGGQGTTAASQITNGSVSVDLSSSTVDAKSLGLQGVQAIGVAGTDIGPGSNTSVQTILQNSANTLSEAQPGFTTFYFTGPGFSNTNGSNQVKVSVNLSSVTDASTLAAAINQAITNAGNASTQQATAFSNANITASINTDSSGKQQLTFSSSSAAFQVQGGDQVATAVLGSFSDPTTGAGNLATTTAAAAGAFVNPAVTETGVAIRILGDGLNGAAPDLSVDITHTTSTADTVVAAINTAIAANSAYAATGIQAVNNAGTIQFTGPTGSSFTVQTAGDNANALGFGAFASSTGTSNTAGTFDYSSLDAGALGTSGKTQGLEFSVNGGAVVDLGVLAGQGNAGKDATTLNAAFQASAQARAAGLVASVDATTGFVDVTSANSTNFRLGFYADSAATNGDAFGFGAAVTTGTAASATAGATSEYSAKDNINSGGAFQSVNETNQDVYAFTALTNNNDQQTVSLSAVDSDGVEHTVNVALTTSNAGNLDQAIATINSAIQQSDDSTIQQIVAVKEVGTSGAVNGVEGIRILDANAGFKVSIGATNLGDGIADGQAGAQGAAPLTAQVIGNGSTADISSQATAEAAVTALASSVNLLGNAQAVVGRGENQFNYAINLAQSQVTNLAAAESSIRDADLAAEAANLTKAQILIQAGVAALAQANSAPQQVLSLLKSS